jgi:hypothetical protein
MVLLLHANVNTVVLTDLVCQSGPGSWPSQVYAESAVYPMAHSAAQVFFSFSCFLNLTSKPSDEYFILWLLVRKQGNKYFLHDFVSYSPGPL